MRDSPVAGRTSHTIGHSFTLLLMPSGSRVAFGPAWAVLSGACAAASSLWREATVSAVSPVPNALVEGASHSLLTLVLVLLIAEVLWSTWRALLVAMGRPIPNCDRQLQAGTDPALSLPYTTPWSPLGRLRGSWGETRRRLQQAASAEASAALPTLVILVPLILVLSALAGSQMVLLSLAAISLAIVEWRIARRRIPHSAVQAALEIGLGWLAGHSLLHQLTVSSFILACCFAISYQGALSLDADDQPSTVSRRTWSLSLLMGGQVAASALLVLTGHPLAAVLVAMLLAPQMLLVSRLGQGASHTWFLQRALPFLMVAMPIAGWVGGA